MAGVQPTLVDSLHFTSRRSDPGDFIDDVLASPQRIRVHADLRGAIHLLLSAIRSLALP
jgi:hypothetical protein